MIGTEPETRPEDRPRAPGWCRLVVAASCVVGVGLISHQAFHYSATYDEVKYLEIGARWWRTGEQETMTRMGTPVTFFKVQQAPTFWVLDRIGLGEWVDRPIERQASLLPWIRLGAAWTWVAGLAVVAWWARSMAGPRGMALASTIYAFSPNLLAHGSLATTEMPLVAGFAAAFALFWRYLRDRRSRDLAGSAIVSGLVFSCKYTAVLIPPLVACLWAMGLWIERDRGAGWGRSAARVAGRALFGMIGFAALMVAADLVVTGFATITLSPRQGAHPLLDGRFPGAAGRWLAWMVERRYPVDWVGFATQVVHQRNGGPSYLLGERRIDGWRHYYPITLAVKVPLAFWFLVASRACCRQRREREGHRGWFVPLLIALFLVAAVVASKRNYGVRYLLPLAGPSIVAVSALAEGRGRARWAGWLGAAGMAAAVISVHPNELSYFNPIGGGPAGGHRILSDSNLDWGQGARVLARLQRDRPELRDLTLYYFGDTDPAYYGVVGRRFGFDAHRPPDDLPPMLSATTRYVAASASLQHGPWGPPGYFDRLDGLEPVAVTADRTIAIYRSADLEPSPDVRSR